jgi:hypothetical protein
LHILANKYSNSNYNAKLNQNDMFLIQYLRRRLLLGLCSIRINSLMIRRKC